MISLATPISKLYGVGDSYAEKLEKLHIITVEDLLYHLPFRYEDWNQTAAVSALKEGEKVTLQGQITDFHNLFTKNGKKIQIATFSDNQSQIQIVWFNQLYLANVMKPGTPVSLSGKVGFFSRKLSLISPTYELLKNVPANSQLASNDQTPDEHRPETIHTGTFVSIYPETSGLTSKWLRAKIKYILDRLPTIPDWIDAPLKKQFSELDELPSLDQAIRAIHFPQDQTQADQSRSRLAFDELLSIHLATMERKAQWQALQSAYHIHQVQNSFETFQKQLPFQLTSAQKKVISHIFKDFTKPTPMNRLIQGDVGSGKTAVAAAAIAAAANNGYQSALMAPTEILATQHFASLEKFLSPLGLTVALQTGRTKHVKPGEDNPFDVVVGTHALLNEALNFDRLALIVIDEQHRFGVNQRAKLIAKGTDEQSRAPHMLSMTATPIPRTIALTLYGDLDLSIIDQLPPGRTPVKTFVVPESKRPASHEWIRAQIAQNNAQVFIVCPFIETSENLESVKAATVEYEHLSKNIFPDLQLALLHGAQKSQDKEQTLTDFRDKKYDILVTTPVVEVGVDIPDATIMIIEGAERFGLAQLHQLRGRVGRSAKQSYCLLFPSTSDALQSKRLKALESTHSGLALAELDLKLRGPGQLYGHAQSGYTDLEIASYQDASLIAKTHQLATNLLPIRNQFPSLKLLRQNRTIQDIALN